MSEPDLVGRLWMVAGPSDPVLLPREGRRGFPHWGRWAEATGRMPGLLQAYLMLNRPGLLTPAATRLAGASDLCSEDWGFPGLLALGRRASLGAVWNTPVAPGGDLLAACRQALEIRAEEGGGAHLSHELPGLAVRLAKTALVFAGLARGVPLLWLGEDGDREPLEQPTRDELWGLATALMQIRARHPLILSDSAPITWHTDDPSRQPAWEGEGASPVGGWSWTCSRVGRRLNPALHAGVGALLGGCTRQCTLPPAA